MSYSKLLNLQEVSGHLPKEEQESFFYRFQYKLADVFDASGVVRNYSIMDSEYAGKPYLAVDVRFDLDYDRHGLLGELEEKAWKLTQAEGHVPGVKSRKQVDRRTIHRQHRV
jgi:hypothetical protein